jgi:hypothetical protein
MNFNAVYSTFIISFTYLKTSLFTPEGGGTTSLSGEKIYTSMFCVVD